MWAKLWRRMRLSKLGLKLLVRISISLAITLGIYALLTLFEIRYLGRIAASSEIYRDEIAATVGEFQHFVSENELKTTDTEAIRLWEKRHSLLDMRLIHDDRILYDSLADVLLFAPKAALVYDSSLEAAQNEIVFADGVAVMYTSPLFQQRLERQLDFVILVVCAVLFAVVLTIELSSLVMDIVRIDEAMQVLESGDLSYRIDLHREDEVGDLADSLNRIAVELSLRNEQEEALRQKSYDMVTSVSHDLRTPLTAIIGYAELLQQEDPEPAQRRRYLATIADRAYFIKDMTDSLFTHFLNRDEEESYRFEVVLGGDFIARLLRTLTESLQENGYTFALSDAAGGEFFMKVDPVHMQRVFNNLEANLFKYADKETSVDCALWLSENDLHLHLSNRIVHSGAAESHGVGMRSCAAIVARHAGSFDAFVERERFHVLLSLPVLSLEEAMQGVQDTTPRKESV